MAAEVNGQQIRQTVLEVIDELSKRPNQYLNSGGILRVVGQRLALENDHELQLAVLTYLHDLFRTGYLAWGADWNNADPPFCHLTSQGRRALEHLSRDPANPDGYLAYLKGSASLNQIANSYITEGLKTYTNDCYKAAAVMIGAASESIIIELKDVLIAKLNSLGRPIPKGMNDWSISQVIKALESDLKSQKKNMPNKLWEEFDSHWSAFIGQIRIARNDAGHPSNIDPVTPERVHASLLIFPDLARIAYEIMAWIPVGYQ